MVKFGEMTQTDIAAALNVSLPTINALVTGRTYRHLHGRKRGDRQPQAEERYGFPVTPERRYEREASFWARVDRSGGVQGCWPFEGAEPGKYGLLGMGISLVGTTATFLIAYILARGLKKAPSSNRVVRHLCNNKPCCNPSHLLLGTHRENQLDRIAAEREKIQVPRFVENPVPSPEGGWIIAVGDPDELERAARASEFWQRVDKSGGESMCWPWIGSTRNKFGYGQMNWEGTTATAHRIAYLLENNLSLQDLSRSIHIRHRCPPGGKPNDCNNPRHLLAGTAADNRADCIEDGTMPMGENHHMGRKSPDLMIRTIREQYWTVPKEKRSSLTEIAAKSGVSINTVSNWLTGKTRLAAGGPIGAVE
ncbi:HNH endonuclease [Streptosporangium sp. NPDC050280]|uniref:HNH endonuclease n=1 Tax=unclassified Streptosporangium TaxID=2632669 RepID=UPI0034161AFC